MIVCDNFRKTREIGGAARKLNSRGQDKGHRAEITAFTHTLLSTEEPWPIPQEELLEVSKATIEAAAQVRVQLVQLGH